MEIVDIEVSKITPYAKNAKKHDQVQIDNVAESIRQFGFVQPLVLDKNNVIVIGHCRFAAAKKLRLKEVPCVYVDTLTGEQVKKLRLLDNKLNESDWNLDLIAQEIANLDFSGFDVDWGILADEPDEKYTTVSNIPQYEIKGEKPSILELVDDYKSKDLQAEIDEANITNEEKRFLKLAAQRHNVFDYAKIAEYYAQATKEMQLLMEKSALVIIDVDNAIANSYAELSEKIEQLRNQDEE